MRMIRTLLKLGAAAAILTASLSSAPSAEAATCAQNCSNDYYLCINVWQLPQSECAIDHRQCLRRC